MFETTNQYTNIILPKSELSFLDMMLAMFTWRPIFGGSDTKLTPIPEHLRIRVQKEPT